MGVGYVVVIVTQTIVIGCIRTAAARSQIFRDLLQMAGRCITGSKGPSGTCKPKKRCVPLWNPPSSRLFVDAGMQQRMTADLSHPTRNASRIVGVCRVYCSAGSLDRSGLSILQRKDGRASIFPCERLSVLRAMMGPASPTDGLSHRRWQSACRSSTLLHVTHHPCFCELAWPRVAIVLVLQVILSGSEGLTAAPMSAPHLSPFLQSNASRMQHAEWSP